MELPPSLPYQRDPSRAGLAQRLGWQPIRHLQPIAAHAQLAQGSIGDLGIRYGTVGGRAAGWAPSPASPPEPGRLRDAVMKWAVDLIRTLVVDWPANLVWAVALDCADQPRLAKEPAA